MSVENPPKNKAQAVFVRIFAGLTGCAVALGAFGAHALKSTRSEAHLEIWKTATLYLLTQSIAGLALSLYNCAAHNKTHVQPAGAPAASVKLILTGSIVFSASLYLLVLLQQPMLGAITPLGGVAMIAGWLMVALRFRT